MNALVTLSNDTIKSRVATTNSFTKEEIVAYRDAIRVARSEKRAKLATMNGSQLGAYVEDIRTTRNAVVSDIKTRTSAKQQTWTIRLTAKVFKTEKEQLMDKAARLQKALNAVEEKVEALTVPVTPTK